MKYTSALLLLLVTYGIMGPYGIRAVQAQTRPDTLSMEPSRPAPTQPVSTQEGIRNPPSQPASRRIPVSERSPASVRNASPGGVPASTQRSSSGSEDARARSASADKNFSYGRGEIQLDPEAMPDAALETIKALSVRGADLRDVLRGMGEEYGVNIIVDDAVRERVTVRLSSLPVIEAVQFLVEEYGLSLVQRGQIFRVFVPEVPQPQPQQPEVGFSDSGLSVDLDGDDLRAVMRAISVESGANIMVSRGVDGSLEGFLQGVMLEEGLRTLLENNGFTLRERDGIYIVERLLPSPGGSAARSTGRAWVEAKDGAVNIEATEASVQDVLREIAAQLDLNLVVYDAPEGTITASVEGLTVDAALALLFKGSSITYRKVEGTYYVGSRETSGIATTELIKLNHMKAEGIPDLLPPTLKGQATLQVVPEYNGLMITGTLDVIQGLKDAIEALDQPTPLILIEALVVDFRSSDLFELGFEFGQDEGRSEAAREKGYTFDEDGFTLEGEDHRANFYLDKLEPFAEGFGIKNIGELPDDFFFKLRALSREGKVEIRSRPQIATLSGHSASLSIGTTQYYILRTETPIQAPGGGVIVQETERFEQIQANVSLEVTPWVTASGEVTTEIRPEFSTPVGSFQAGIPPTISSRVFESTVRLRDGETIILGGLVQDDNAATYNKVPILGSIPLLGQLFRSRAHDRQKSELVVYLTPRIFYGSESEAEKWQEYREEQDLPDPKR